MRTYFGLENVERSISSGMHGFEGFGKYRINKTDHGNPLASDE